jgi:putative acyl-CoA dehydrogenase
MATISSSGAANQVPPLAGHDLFTCNPALVEALEREGGGWAAERCSSFGRALTGEPLEWGRLANENPPKLRWTADREGAHVARAALFMLAAQVEAGDGCPVSMTHAAVPAVRAAAPECLLPHGRVS